MHYGQNKKDKRTNKENTTEKTKNRVTRTSLKSGDELRCSGEVGTINHKSIKLNATQIYKLANIILQNLSHYIKEKYITIMSFTIHF
jgi:hypothetical protein